MRAFIQQGQQEGVLRINTAIGRVPSTATGDTGARREVFAAVRGLTAAVPQDWRLGLLPDHQVMLQVQRPIALPITATGLLTQITAFLLELAPYLELMDETGIHPGPVEADQRLN
jgi:hypothetical protein